MYRCQNINRFKGPIITTRNRNGLRGRANSQWICLQQPKHQRDLWLRWKFSFMIEVNVIVFFFFFIMLYIQCGYNFFFLFDAKMSGRSFMFFKNLDSKYFEYKFINVHKDDLIAAHQLLPTKKNANFSLDYLQVSDELRSVLYWKWSEKKNDFQKISIFHEFFWRKHNLLCAIISMSHCIYVCNVLYTFINYFTRHSF